MADEQQTLNEPQATTGAAGPDRPVGTGEPSIGSERCAHGHGSERRGQDVESLRWRNLAGDHAGGGLTPSAARPINDRRSADARRTDPHKMFDDTAQGPEAAR